MTILSSYQIQTSTPYPLRFPSLSRQPNNPKPNFPLRKSPRPIYSCPLTAKSQHTHHSKPQSSRSQDDGIPIDDVKTIARFKSRHNYIRVLEVSRRANHPFAGSRLLLLDGPGNIHSISFLFKSLTNTYFDVFATLPPILPPGPVAILGFGAGSAARSILELYSQVTIHGWELDPSVVSVGREYFGLSKLEKEFPDRLFIYIGDALRASSRDGFSGILVDLFSRGSLIPELQDPNTWAMLRRCLRKGGRVMVNVGGSCVEAEDSRRDGRVVMEETLKAMSQVFGRKLFVLSLGNREEDSSLALTGPLPDLDAWRKALPRSLVGYVDMWRPFSS
ncbi:S-adenosyl-L-methionine-dependent methyltransferase [Parasponia andersonii]|uniref:S-adenosyl-L-methionine-dependent methyltransferase n=1 Tax=Parasponia andersonii TaxID=3476 RepID=A0A2P5DG45_PARAD|nr:S-adenosyl-L-methionine-dependent methyltransferase [Parasponia andersonii]